MQHQEVTAGVPRGHGGSLGAAALPSIPGACFGGLWGEGATTEGWDAGMGRNHRNIVRYILYVYIYLTTNIMAESWLGYKSIHHSSSIIYIYRMYIIYMMMYIVY